MTRRTCASVDCQKTFLVKTQHARYCSDRCRWHDHKQKVYKERIKQGLCPQCGNEMTTKTSSSYCENCQKYFRQRYYSEKE